MTKETQKEKELKKQLNKKQMDFVLEYLKTNNITKSEIKAGYSKKTAAVQGSRLLTNVKIASYVEAVNERMESDKIADIQEVMEYFTSVMRGEKKDQFDLDPTLSDRTKAASELAKRLDIREKTINVNGVVNIIDNIPEDAEIIDDED